MGKERFRTQRQYTTTIKCYEDMKEAIQKNKGCRIRGDSKGNFTFYLKNNPVRIQFTSQKHFLKLAGLKPHGFLSDLKVIRELTSILKDFYPQGIDFKLDKENITYYDKDEIITMQNEVIKLLQRMLIRAMVSRESFERFKNELWKGYTTDLELRNQFAEKMNNAFAQMICENGFRCKPEGTLKFKVQLGNRRINPLLAKYVHILSSSGFL